MPNHVSNEIRVTGSEEEVKAFLERARVSYVQPPDPLSARFQPQRAKAQTVEREFSFRGFVVPPAHPDYTGGSCGHHHPSPGLADYYRKQYGANSPLVAAQLVQDEHPNCWYVWNNENWGTKWDAYDVVVGGASTILERLATASDERSTEVVRFDTAWAPPIPVFEAMADQFPELNFVFSWMNEDQFGSGGGWVEAKNGVLGEIVDGINDPEDPETGPLWWALAKGLQGYTREQYQEYLDEVAEDNRLAAEAAAKKAAGIGDEDD